MQNLGLFVMSSRRRKEAFGRIALPIQSSGRIAPGLFIMLIVAAAFVLGNCTVPSAWGPRSDTPPATAATPAKPAWQIEWESALAEARKEGKVMIYGAPGSEVRLAMVEGFQKAYPEITVDYLGGPSSQNAAKINAERRARRGGGGSGIACVADVGGSGGRAAEKP